MLTVTLNGGVFGTDMWWSDDFPQSLRYWFKQNLFIHRNHKLSKQVQETLKQYAYLSVTFVCSVHARSLWINTTVGHLYASPLLPGKEQDSHLGTNIQQTRPWTVCVSSASDVFVESLRHAGQSGDLKTALHETKSGSGSVLFLFLRLYSPRLLLVHLEEVKGVLTASSLFRLLLC